MIRRLRRLPPVKYERKGDLTGQAQNKKILIWPKRPTVSDSILGKLPFGLTLREHISLITGLFVHEKTFDATSATATISTIT